MAMLTHDFEQPFRSPARSPAVKPDATSARRTAIKQICVSALTVLLAGGLLAAGIALKTAIYFARFHLGAG